MPEKNIQTAAAGNQGNINPFHIAASAETALAYHDAKAKGLEGAMKQRDEHHGQLLRSKKEATDSEGNLDFDKVTEFSGSKDDKANKVMLANSRLTGIEQAVKELRAEAVQKADAEKIIEQNGGVSTLVDAHGQPLVQNMGPRDLPAYSELAETQVKEQLQCEYASDEFRKRVMSNGVNIELARPLLTGSAGRRSRAIMAALFDTTDWEPNKIYAPGFLPSRGGSNVPIQITQLFYSGPMAGKNITYWEETTYTPVVATRAEGGAAGESEYTLSERSLKPVSIAHYLPLTEEALEDRAELDDYVDYVMPLGVAQKVDEYLAKGVHSDFSGVTKGSGASNAFPRVGTGRFKIAGATSAAVTNYVKPWNIPLDAKFGAMDHGFGILGQQMPNTMAVHPSVWLQMLKSESSSGGYYIAGPQMGTLFSAPWGMTLAPTTLLETAASEDTAAKHKYSGVVFDNSPMFSKLYYRHGINVRFGMINDDFIKFRIAVRAEVRACFAVKRAAAFVLLVNPKADGTAPTT